MVIESKIQGCFALGIYYVTIYNNILSIVCDEKAVYSQCSVVQHAVNSYSMQHTMQSHLAIPKAKNFF